MNRTAKTGVFLSTAFRKALKYVVKSVHISFGVKYYKVKANSPLSSVYAAVASCNTMSTEYRHRPTLWAINNEPTCFTL